MSFSWDRIGKFESVLEAEQWCDRQNVDPRDRNIRPAGDGAELLIRAGATIDERPNGASW